MPRTLLAVICALGAWCGLGACSGSGASSNGGSGGAGVGVAGTSRGATAGSAATAGQASPVGGSFAGSGGESTNQAGDAGESAGAGGSGGDAGTAGAVTSAGTGSAGQPATPPFSVRAVFGVPPDNSGAQDPTIENEILRYLAGVPAGGSIRVAMYYWNRNNVADALVEAQARGVHVYVVSDGNTDYAPSLTRLEGTIEKLVRCLRASLGTACIGTASYSTQHNKLFLLSSSVLSGVTHDEVAIVSSQNLTWGELTQHENALIFEGDSPLYAFYAAYFDDLLNQRTNADYYNAADGKGGLKGVLTSSESGASVYLSPRLSSAGELTAEAKTDTVALELARMTKFETGCYVHAVQSDIKPERQAVLDQLLRIAALGCDVLIVYDDVDPAVQSSLGFAAGSKAVPHLSGKHYNVPVTVDTSPYTVTVHSKYFLMKGYIDGKVAQVRTYSGTQNWLISALRANDENLIKLADPSVFAAFDANFATVWAKAP
jgi:phosphatidylserine/phosphatidylglycerophosphate/cardiolipin synthase-like enzyme